MNNAEGAIEFIEKLGFLIFESARFKVAYGGRGAGKSEGFAIALILLARAKRLRILCLRELQASIEESVLETIAANISSMGFDDEFLITRKQVIHKKTGSRFIFSGLRYNLNKIKSLGRIDIAWVEEAVNVSKISWDKLVPTIRGRYDADDKGGPFSNGPEIWISFNPELEQDETYKRFVIQKHKYAPDYVVIRPDGDVLLNNNGSIYQPKADEIVPINIGTKMRYAIVKKVNYTDNKFFPADLRLQMQVDKAASEDKYLEVWEGHTKQVIEGAVYAEELRQVLRDGRRGKVPYNPAKPVYTFWDLGHSDKTAIWFIQRIGLEYNITANASRVWRAAGPRLAWQARRRGERHWYLPK